MSETAGSWRIDTSPSGSPSNPTIFTLYYMAPEDSWAYGVWEPVCSRSTLKEVEDFRDNPPAWWGGGRGRISQDDVKLLFTDHEPSVIVQVRGVDVAVIVLPGLELPDESTYDGYWSGTDADDVNDPGQFLIGTWANDGPGGALESFKRLHKGAWDHGPVAPAPSAHEGAST